MAEGSQIASTASGSVLQIGSRVEVVAKNLLGKVVFIGETEFSSGKWIGVVLDKPCGKNNGIINGKEYFRAPENHGLFVRQTQLRVISDRRDHGMRVPSFHSSNSSIASSIKSNTREPMTSSITAPGSGLKPPTKRVPTMSTSGSSVAPSSSSIPATPVVIKTQPSVSLPSPTTESPLVNELQAQVRDLQEKLETLMMRRNEDKGKLKEYEKCKIQLEYLEKYKKQMTESHSELQKQLAMAKREAKDAQEALAKRQNEVHELEETAEMATLDKEMAEEKFENLQREMEQLKEKLELATLDLEIMKSELDSKDVSTGSDGQPVTSYQIKQLESKNDKLTEALLKLRDLSIEDKSEISKLQKELEKYKVESDDLRAAKEKLTHEVRIYEEQINDLKEQVDTALGSHEMVEILTDKNLALEEKLDKLLEDQEILEKLLDANEQLLEEQKSSEQDLVQERDMLQGTINKLIHEKEATKSVIVDFETTITKFRSLVAELRKENNELKTAKSDSITAAEKEFASKVEHDQENIDYKIRLKDQKIKDLEEQLAKANEMHATYEEKLSDKVAEITALNSSIEALRASYEEKEGQAANLKKALKSKIEELSEAIIRRDLAEKKLSNANKDSDEKGVQLQEQVAKLQAALESKKKEYEETLTHLQSDMDRSEAQTVELKKQLKLIASKTRMGPSSLVDSPHTPRSEVLSNVFSSPSAVMSTSICQPGSPLEESYIQQINSLKRAISFLKQENYSLLLQTNCEKMSLDCNYTRQARQQLITSTSASISQLRKQISSLEREAASLILNLRVSGMTAKDKREMGIKSAQINSQLILLKSQLNHLLNPFDKGQSADEILAKITLPSATIKPPVASVVPVTVSLNQLKQLHASILA